MNTTNFTVVASKGTIQVGISFVDAVIGKLQSHGSIELRRAERSEFLSYIWASTQPIGETEHALRSCAEKQGLRVSNFTSQAL